MTVVKFWPVDEIHRPELKTDKFDEGVEIMTDSCVLEMRDIEKSFSGNKVLKGISFGIKKGEILSIIGENGAGKSTLMNILFGMPVIHNTGGFSGKILFDGKEVSISSPQHAMELGIGMVHQEFMLIPNFTATENIKLNRELTKRNLISQVVGKNFESLDMVGMKRDSRQALDRIGMNISEDTLVEGMPVGYMQFIECAREIDKKNIRVIVFDEPTAVLTESEAKQLLDAMKKIAASGVGIIFISHKLDEVLSVSDRIVVMRDGELVSTLDSKQTNTVELAELMVGRGINADEIAVSRNFEKAPVVLSAKKLKVFMPGELVKGVDFEVKEGEILGIAGLAGYGKIGIANGIMGLYDAEGTVLFRGEPLPLKRPLEVMKRHINFVSEDRKGVGLVLESSIERNIITPALRVRKKFLKQYGWFSQLDKKQMRHHAEKMIEELSIKCTGPGQRVGALSGGNQQKVCIAAALTLEPELLLVSEPTRGIDIGAKQIILNYLKRLNREQGMTIMITSSELKELRTICDRVIVITNGKVAGELKPDSSDAEYGLLMSGSRIEKTEGGMRA